MFRGPKPETRGERQREKILPGRIQLLSHKTKEWKQQKKCGVQVLISKVVQVLIVKKDGEDRKEKKCDEIWKEGQNKLVGEYTY